MNRKKRKFRYDRLVILLALTAIVIFLIYFATRGIIFAFSALFPKQRALLEDIAVVENYNNLLPPIEASTSPEKEPYVLTELDYSNSEQLGSTVESQYAITYCVETRQVIANKASKEKMYPASMTKIMTLVVAVENISDLNDTFTMTYEITDPLYQQNATVTGLKSGETVPLIDLLYGIILPSGADATEAIAQYVCGTEEEFVELMNKKAEEMGLKDTHFTNTSGLHNTNHYTTAHDMALILDYAIHDELCNKILSTYKYVTTKTPEHPDGIDFYSTMFNKVKTDQIDGMEISGGKTGYTYESGHCLASFSKKNSRTYITVTAKGESKYIPIYDMIAILEEYIA